MLDFGKQELSGEGFTLTAEHLFLRFVSLHSIVAALLLFWFLPQLRVQLLKYDL
jgi:hypothetical protein